MRFDQELLNEERKLSKVLDNAKDKNNNKKSKKTTNTSTLVRQDDGSYARSNTSIHKVTAKKQTSGINKNNIVKSIVRKSASKSTRHK